MQFLSLFTSLPRNRVAVHLAVTWMLCIAIAPSVSAGSWETLPPMPTPRSEMSAVVWEDLIYVPGGLGGPSRFEAFDTLRGRWLSMPDLPEGRHHIAIAVLAGKIYLFGGADANWQATDTTWMFNIVTNQWQRRASMPAARYAAAAVVIEPYIYVVGGDGPGGHALRYDPASDTWTRLAVNLQRREHTSAVAWNGQLMVIGGRWRGAGEFKSTELYDPHSNHWRPGPPLLTARGGFTAVNHGGRIYALGGEVVMQGRSTLDSVEVLDQDTWRIVDTMPLALHGVPVVSHQGAIYVLGGSQRAGAIVNNGQSFRWIP